MLVLRIVLNVWIMSADARAGTLLRQIPSVDRAHREEVLGLLDGGRCERTVMRTLTTRHFEAKTKVRT